MLRDLIPWFFPTFAPFEKAALEGLCLVVPKQLQPTLQLQIEAIRRVTRMPKMTHLYFCYGRDECPVFKTKSEECLWGRFSANIVDRDGCGVPFTCDVWLVKGKLFSLEFDATPQAFLALNVIENPRFVVREVVEK
jgi:hypothetical protein